MATFQGESESLTAELDGNKLGSSGMEELEAETPISAFPMSESSRQARKNKTITITLSVLAAVFGICAIVLAAVLASSTSTVQTEICKLSTPPNIIYFIGDGFGPQGTSFIRMFEQENVSSGANHSTGELYGIFGLDKAHCGLSFVQTCSGSNIVTDSAASGTALATGQKTRNKCIGVKAYGTDDKGVPIGNVLEAAKLAGYNTGVISTSSVTHATPASFSAHVQLRTDEELIAEQQSTLQKGFIDLMMGGGYGNFAPELRSDGKDFIEELKKNGFTILRTKEDMDKEGLKLPVAGLFTDYHMPYVIDRPYVENSSQIPHLEEMVAKAISLFEAAGKPFFIMVEGSLIDFAEHSNDPAAMVAEATHFLKALNVGIKGAIDNGNTVVLSTSDHDTGGLSINGGVNFDVVKKVKASNEFIANVIEEQVSQGSKDLETAVREALSTYAGITEITSEEMELFNSLTYIEAVANVISNAVGVKWGDTQHTATNVLLYQCVGGWKKSKACLAETGKNSWLPLAIDNTEIPKLVETLTRSDLEKASERARTVFTGHTEPSTIEQSTRDIDSNNKDGYKHSYNVYRKKF